jgi:hypothetical protein
MRAGKTAIYQTPSHVSSPFNLPHRACHRGSDMDKSLSVRAKAIDQLHASMQINNLPSVDASYCRKRRLESVPRAVTINAAEPPVCHWIRHSSDRCDPSFSPHHSVGMRVNKARLASCLSLSFASPSFIRMQLFQSRGQHEMILSNLFN